jgi:hypothetical protein
MYLVQRGTVKVEAYNGEKVSDYLQLDYMGSAEFEFGALPKSIRAMAAKKLEVLPFHWEERTIYVLCEKQEYEKVISKLGDYLIGKRRLKEHISLRDIIEGASRSYDTDNFWWEIEGHYAFSLNEDYVKNFQKAVKKSVEFMDKEKKIWGIP